MNQGFWDTLPRPFFVLAPLANVTDAAFRRVIAARGKPDVFYTECVSADGLCSPGRDVLLRDLEFSDAEHPIVAQLFTANPERMHEAARLVAARGFDGIDVNMGCPDRNVEKQGAGAALMKNPAVAPDVLPAAKAGAGGLPVSVKTRIGYRTNAIDTWLPELLAEEPAAIAIHARTRKEMSDVDAHWDTVAQAVALAKGSGTFIIGNGDVADLNDARQKAEATGADGIMLGRAIFGNPWLFALKQKASLEKHENFLQKIFSVRRRHSSQGFSRELSVSTQEKLKVMVEHTKLFEKMLGKHKNFAIMKKHYKAYANNFDGAKELRVKLMETENAEQLERVINDFLHKI